MEQKTVLLRSDNISLICSTEFVVECTMNGEVEKILGVNADAVGSSAEALEGECTLNGKINFKVLAKTADGVKSFDYFSDYATKVKGEFAPTMKLITKCKVIDAEAKLGAEIKAQSTVAVDIFALKAVETPVIADIDGACCKCRQAESNTCIGTFSAIGSVDDEFNASCDEIILLDTSAVFTKATCGENVILVEGVAYASVTYQNDKGIFSHVSEMTISEEIEATGVDLTSSASATLSVDSARVVLGEDNTTGIEINIAIDATAWKTVEECVLADAFSIDKEMSLDTCTRKSTKVLATTEYDEKVSGSAIIGADAPLISRVVTVCGGRNTVTNTATQNGNVVVEGVVCATVIYLDQADNVNSVLIEMPYSINLNGECNETDVAEISSAISDVSAIAKRENEVEVICKLKFSVTLYKEHTEKYVVGFTEGKEKEKSTYPISVRFGERGASLWETARYLNVTPEELQNNNPDMVFPLSGGEKIVRYNMLSCN